MEIKVFFDANIYFSAARSLLGGSGFVIELARKRKLKLFATKEVLKEAERNLRLKEEIKILLRHYGNLEFVRPKIIEIDKSEAKKRFGEIINEKDAMVLAGAENSKVNYLVTLDKRHFFAPKVRSAKLPFKIITPGQLIEEFCS